MSFVSILNDVLGPVMRGPSSSHTAGAHRIATVARDLLGEEPREATVVFDPGGSYAPTYKVCGVDKAFTCGLLRIDLIDERFLEIESVAHDRGLRVAFEARVLPNADHPNYMEMRLVGGSGVELSAAAASVGGGLIELREVDGVPVQLDGKAWALLVRGDEAAVGWVRAIAGEPLELHKRGEEWLAVSCRDEPLAEERRAALESAPGVHRVYQARPLFLLRRGDPPFVSAKEMVAFAESRSLGLGETALAYEAQVLGLSEGEVTAELLQRLEVMKRSVEDGIEERGLRMRLLAPSAREMMAREHAGRLTLGGPHARAAARALAATHVNNSMGVVCAAPTGGSAGTIPAVLVTLTEDLGLSDERAILALAAAGAIGLIVATRGTFAAETAGCQVEIGAAGAMAAAGVVQVFGGTARQACDAAAIAFQNTMGLVCDPVQGACEVPCHTRNAVAASSAFTCADLALGGYANPIPLDETIDAVMEVGRLMAPELRCTARGGIAIAPSAQTLGSGPEGGSDHGCSRASSDRRTR